MVGVTGFRTRLCATLCGPPLSCLRKAFKSCALEQVQIGKLQTKKQKREDEPLFSVFWSEWQDSNLRHRRPKRNDSSFLCLFWPFLMLFSPKSVLSCTLLPTVSTYSEAVDGQICGQAPTPIFFRHLARATNSAPRWLLLSPLYHRSKQKSSHFTAQKLRRRKQRNYRSASAKIDPIN